MGENGGEVGQIDREGVEERRRTLISFARLFTLSNDIALAGERFAIDDLENRVFPLAQNADRSFREFLDQLIGKSRERSPADHDLALGKLLADQPGVRQVRANVAVVSIELLQACEGGHHTLDRVTGKVEIERVLQ